MRERFDVTLPRFDLMAQLDKVPEGMTLSEVSKRMMVSNGNVTGLVERLVVSGHLYRRTSELRSPRPGDPAHQGRPRRFRKMAAEHDTWIADIFLYITLKDVPELMRWLARPRARRRNPPAGGRCSPVADIDYEIELKNGRACNTLR